MCTVLPAWGLDTALALRPRRQDIHSAACTGCCPLHAAHLAGVAGLQTTLLVPKAAWKGVGPHPAHTCTLAGVLVSHGHQVCCQRAQYRSALPGGSSRLQSSLPYTMCPVTTIPSHVHAACSTGGAAWPGCSLTRPCRFQTAPHMDTNPWPACSYSRRLTFPRQVHLLDNGSLSAYSLLSGRTAQVAPLPASNVAGQEQIPVGLVHSRKQSAWLVFYQVQASAADRKGQPAGAGGWTLVTQASLASAAALAWTLPGQQCLALQPGLGQHT